MNKSPYETTKQEATTAAKALAKALGSKWKIRVWENMGWHYNVASPCNQVKITPFIYGGKIDSYTAFFGSAEDNYCGGRWAESGKTPKAALRAVIKRATCERDEIDTMLKAVSECGKP